jgi:IclR family transcriptional regulator, mhp operon transcriptional activator
MPLSLTRGLEVLVLLNKRESASVADIRQALKIPRASLYRILESLIADGYVYQHRSDQRYRLTLQVLALSEGFSDGQHLASVARPFLTLVTQSVRWPVSFGTLSGLDLVVRENTDDESPLATDEFKIGYRMPLLTTATGLCILAHLDAGSRDAVLSALAQREPASALSVRERAALEQRLRDIRSRGYSTYNRRRQRTDATSIAVPVIDADAVVRGAVTLRFATAAVRPGTAVATFVPVLAEAAGRIAARIPKRVR